MNPFHLAFNLTHLFFVLDLLLILTFAVFLILISGKAKTVRTRVRTWHWDLLPHAFILVVTMGGGTPTSRVTLWWARFRILVLYQAFFLLAFSTKEFRGARLRRLPNPRRSGNPPISPIQRAGCYYGKPCNFAVRTLFIRYVVPAVLLV